jgi:hypothetical protein
MPRALLQALSKQLNVSEFRPSIHPLLIILFVAGFTVITSAGGAAFTLAPSAEGVVTSIAGHEFTIATADLGSLLSGGPSGSQATSTQSHNAALGGRAAFHIPSTLQLATLLGGAFVGAALVF